MEQVLQNEASCIMKTVPSAEQSSSLDSNNNLKFVCE